MKIVIRDDDTSFFTQPEELEQAYDFVREGPVSLSVVPRTVPHHEKGVLPYGEGIPAGYYPVGDNAELVAYLKHNSRYDLMLHGHTHEYRQIDGKWYPEMLWKDEARVREELRQGKEYLESLFDREITVFVAPSNAVNAQTIRAVEALRMHYCGIIHHGDRDFSARYALNFLRRWGYRLRTGLRIPDVLDYGGHKEMVSHPLDSYDKLIREYEESKKRRAPFCVYTHYWHLNRDPQSKLLLERLYRHMTEDGAELVSLSSCFEDQ